MSKKKFADAYVWYSGATDITGQKIAEALGCKHGNKKPAKASVVLGWGTKVKDRISTGSTPYLNNPNAILDNRNKLKALELMDRAKVAVAPFATAKDLSKIGKGKTLPLPVIGRTSFHQGGKGFWLCPTMSHVRGAAEGGAGYFQELIEIDEEYRFHVVGDKVVYAVKKVKMTPAEYEESYVKHELERQESLAKKKGEKFDEKGARSVLKRQAQRATAAGPDMVIRSNRRGWKFSRVTKWKSALETEAVKALKAIGLDYGAVDCCVDADGKAWIIEVNTGPGLEGSAFTAWTEALTKLIDEKLNVKKSSSGSDGGTTKKVVAAKKTESKAMAAKEKLKARLSFMQDLAESVETDDEAEALDRIFARVSQRD